MRPLTAKQKQIVDFVAEYIDEKGCPPSYRDIRDRFGFRSLGTVYKHVQRLVEKGALLSEKGRSRSLTHPDNGREGAAFAEGVEVPLIGLLRGDAPLETYPVPQKITLPASLVNQDQTTYVLRVGGDGLLHELIAHGDLLIVESREPYYDGETALVIEQGGRVLVRKVFFEGANVRLCSRATALRPLVLPRQEVQLLGSLTGLVRLYS